VQWSRSNNSLWVTATLKMLVNVSRIEKSSFSESVRVLYWLRYRCKICVEYVGNPTNNNICSFHNSYLLLTAVCTMLDLRLSKRGKLRFEWLESFCKSVLNCPTTMVQITSNGNMEHRNENIRFVFETSILPRAYKHKLHNIISALICPLSSKAGNWKLFQDGYFPKIIFASTSQAHGIRHSSFSKFNPIVCLWNMKKT
jgi:hypothetical protein